MIIYKYKIEVVNQWFKLAMPQNAAPIAFQSQPTKMRPSGGRLCLWVEIEKNDILIGAPNIEFDFICLGTGIEMGIEKAEYIGTAQTNGFVWHLYWRPLG